MIEHKMAFFTKNAGLHDEPVRSRCIACKEPMVRLYKILDSFVQQGAPVLALVCGNVKCWKGLDLSRLRTWSKNK